MMLIAFFVCSACMCSSRVINCSFILLCRASLALHAECNRSKSVEMVGPVH